MKLHKKTLYINTTILVALAVFGAFTAGGLGMGIVFVLFGVADLLIGLILLIAGVKDAGTTLLLYAGVLLLTGFSVCSLIPFTSRLF